MKKLLLATLAFSTIMTSCDSRNSSKTTTINLNVGKYFSMRQQTVTTYVSLIQLSLPSLLAEAKVENGRSIIDEDLKAAVMAQQEQVIAKLKSISPDIQIITTYKLVLNAIAFTAPSDLAIQIEGIEGVNKVIESTKFARPATLDKEQKIAEAIANIKEKNTITFIGADKLHKLGISGEKMTVGIIDSGIDYTHKMFGGAGTKEIYDSINPETANEHFPNAKVVGGVDFVGINFSSGDSDPNKSIPRRDPNPIDESGHGSHVAGSVAGHGDDITSYSGVAPEASLYALKVFGKEGSTSDVAVIAALEYAADPTETINPLERLDVVNLSLGSTFGQPKILYTEAIKNLTKAGTIVVASAGNSGDTQYITGAPGTSDEAISVAASIDYMSQNTTIPAVELKIAGVSQLLEIVEGYRTTPANSSKVSGGLIAIGNGTVELSEEVKAKVKGKIVLMDRGIIDFEKKFEFAQSLGAVGVVMVNNVDGPPIPMGGDKEFKLPAVMISLNIGESIKQALLANIEVIFDFSTDQIINREDLIDTITDFSSRGPRSMDSMIKPEIAGPGANVISTGYGTGDKVVQMSGTSMSGPHLAGVMALMRQAFPTDSVPMLKARILNNAKILMKDGVHVPVARQGAGRVQVEEAYLATVVAFPATLSLGEVPVASQKTVSKKFTLTNTSDKDVVFSTKIISSKNIKGSIQSAVKVKAKSAATFAVSFVLARTDASLNNVEADGFIILTSSTGSKISLPFLAVLNKVSEIKASDLITQTVSKIDAPGSEVKLTLTNIGKSSGDALIFNLLGTDDKKTLINSSNLSSNTMCDLESAGIRIIEKMDMGYTTKVLQIGVKIYDAMTTWNPCDVSLQIDSDNDGIADQELLGIKTSQVAGIFSPNEFSSVLLDAKLSREVRHNYEVYGHGEIYTKALISLREMKFYNHSNVVVMEADLAKILKGKNGQIGIKLALTHLEADFGGDDFLGNHDKKWQQINLSENAFAFYGMPEVVTVNEGAIEAVSMKRGVGNMKALILYPHNTPASLKDQQSQILTEKLIK